MVIVQLFGINFQDSLIIVISLFIALSFAFNQVPYVIGQSLMRRKILANIQGLQKGEVLETMDKYMPLFPMARYLTMLSMSGTAGFFIFKFLNKVFVDALGKTLGISQ